MGQFDQFANQGGPAAESADALAEARRKADEQLRTADYSGELPEPLPGGEHVADGVTDSDPGTAAGSAPPEPASPDDAAGERGDGSA